MEQPQPLTGAADEAVALLDQRGQLLRAAVGFARCSLPSNDRALWALRTWLDSWSRIGNIAWAWIASWNHHALRADKSCDETDGRGLPAPDRDGTRRAAGYRRPRHTRS